MISVHNVPGALSSQGGQDFCLVLESLVRIKAPAADVPLPESGRWLHAGEILGDGYSLAWRILDAAQGWGAVERGTAEAAAHTLSLPNR